MLASVVRDGKGPGLQLDGTTAASDPIVGERKAYFPENVEQAKTMMERIARDLREQYTIGYVPTTAAEPVVVDKETPLTTLDKSP